jgi:hypothetical protein
MGERSIGDPISFGFLARTHAQVSVALQTDQSSVPALVVPK